LSKKSKKQRKAEREAARAAVRKAERQRNIATGVVLAIVVAIGALLVFASLDPPPEEAAQPFEEPEDIPDEPRSVEPPPGPQPPPDPDADERPIACDGQLPPRAADTRPVYSVPEQVTEDGVSYEAVMETSCGAIQIDLDADRAPVGVNAFVFLAVEGFYDGLEIFRHAQSIGVFQTGAGSNDASFQIGYHLPDELVAALEDGYPEGAVAYANAGPGTSGSQFFLVYGDAFQEGIDEGFLQPVFTRFGLVTEGLDVLERMAEIPVEGERPAERIYIESVTILADGEPVPVVDPMTQPTPSPGAQPTPTPGALTPAPDPEED
jgi:peptidyl-prolyl cis-trans isomerase B (cyclophilin B)